MVSQLVGSFSRLSVASSSPHVARSRVASRRSSFMGALPVLAPARTQVIDCTTDVVCKKGGIQSGGKLKTRKAVAKRFKITGSGKVMRRSQNKQHLNEKYKHSKLKSLSKTKVVANSDINNIKSCLPYKKIRTSNPDE
ncbi:hypothetical protein BSKO_13156 [Bryopsis sp. KO-2023]|nr:hypothetical protein BSKO_13156 [Bryopsis sp. KO-2023]